MPPVDHKSTVKRFIQSAPVFIFSKSYCPYCKKVKALFDTLKTKYEAIELDLRDDGEAIQAALADMTGQKTVPSVFVNSNHLGGCDDTLKAQEIGKLSRLLTGGSAEDEGTYDYDLIVIGGGSGGLAASKEAAGLGAKVCVLDYVKPSPRGTTWGLGGTCVNVGCIPKKLMHQAALLGESIKDAPSYGWKVPEALSHDWERMKEGVQNHIGSLNWGYRMALRQKSVEYRNAFGEFINSHTLKLTDKKDKTSEISGRYLLIAVGGRPRYPDIPGAKEYCISSDDLFSLPYRPGKTLCIGASYVSLECAGFLRGIGCDVTVMVRSILLRGFDQQMAELVGESLEGHGVNLVRACVPTKIEQLEEGYPGKLAVTGKYMDGTDYADQFNTVLIAVGRDAVTSDLGLDRAGVRVSSKNGKVITNDSEQSNVPNVFAIGDCSDGRPELTPVAIQAGRLLARRLFGGASEKMNYELVPTTVFTPLEYGCVGLSEEAAVDRYGEDRLDVFHQKYTPLEHTVPHRPENGAYAKLVCLKESGKVVGLHVAGPNSGEVTQGFALGIKLGATKDDFDATVGIHPTCAETLTTLNITKGSGTNAESTGC